MSDQMIEQRCGDVTITAFTDGHPISVKVIYRQWNGDVDEFRMNPEHLHDLRYCIDRVLCRIEEGKRS